MEWWSFRLRIIWRILQVIDEVLEEATRNDKWVLNSLPSRLPTRLTTLPPAAFGLRRASPGEGWGGHRDSSRGETRSSFHAPGSAGRSSSKRLLSLPGSAIPSCARLGW